jgi:cation diffusion facilitator family transporter
VGSSDNIGRRVAVASMLVSALLAALKITVGIRANSTAVVSDGFESAADVFTSGLVFLGLLVASKPPDREHPYGHGRFEIVTALAVGAILTASGVMIAWHALQRVGTPRQAPALLAVWPLLISIAVKGAMGLVKRHYGRRIRSAALVADASNDAMDALSAGTALAAIGIALWNPARLAAADDFGGCAVGLIVLALGIRVMRDTVYQLMDTMPDERLMDQVRDVALTVPGALGIEKCYARKTGLQYHVDLHLEVDPGMTVLESHDIAAAVREQVRERLEWVADVLVHVEPHGLDVIDETRPRSGAERRR